MRSEIVIHDLVGGGERIVHATEGRTGRRKAARWSSKETG